MSLMYAVGRMFDADTQAKQGIPDDTWWPWQVSAAGSKYCLANTPNMCCVVQTNRDHASATPSGKDARGHRRSVAYQREMQPVATSVVAQLFDLHQCLHSSGASRTSDL